MSKKYFGKTTTGSNSTTQRHSVSYIYIQLLCSPLKAKAVKDKANSESNAKAEVPKRSLVVASGQIWGR